MLRHTMKEISDTADDIERAGHEAETWRHLSRYILIDAETPDALSRSRIKAGVYLALAPVHQKQVLRFVLGLGDLGEHGDSDSGN